MSLHELEIERQTIIRLRENLIDEDMVVDDIRNEINRYPQRLRDALARRECTAWQLDQALRQWTQGMVA